MQQYSTSWKPKARREEKEIYDYYEVRKEGLGEEFLNEQERVETILTKYPKIYQIVHKNIRQAALKRFEYKISFVVNETQKQIIIIAVTHNKRHERNWKARG